jgi:hypothetical protein
LEFDTAGKAMAAAAAGLGRTAGRTTRTL